MLRLQQSRHDEADVYYQMRHGRLKLRALVTSLALYAATCLFFFMESWWGAPPPTVVVRSDAAPVLFMSSGRKGGAGAVGRVKGPQASEQRRSVPAQPKAQKKPPMHEQKKEQKLPPKSVKGVVSNRKKLPLPAPKKDSSTVTRALEKKVEKRAEQPRRQQEPVASKACEPLAVEVPRRVAEPVPEVPVVAEEQQSPDDLNDPIIIGGGAGEGDGGVDRATKACIALNRAITRVWRPPNVRTHHHVRLMVHVDGAGAVRDAEIVQKSGVVVYDIAARAAVLRAEVPREFWGKTIAIVFGS